MATLLVRCEGPMQSWGTRSRFADRDTERFVSKSGIVGLLASALGRPRHAPVDDLAGLRMSVRVDREGRVERDFQTAMNVPKADGSKGATVISHRYYLADASFLVALEGDAALLSQAHQALAAPQWPLFLGRRGYVPSVPPFIPDGLRDEPAADLLLHFQWPVGMPQAVAYLESDPDQGGHQVRDVPLDFASTNRRYGQRWVRAHRLESPQEGPKEDVDVS